MPIRTYPVNLDTVHGCFLSVHEESANYKIFKKQFVLIKKNGISELFYITTNGDVEKVNINDFQLLEENLNKLKKHPSDTWFLLSREMVLDLITANGGYRQLEIGYCDKQVVRLILEKISVDRYIPKAKPELVSYADDYESGDREVRFDQNVNFRKKQREPIENESQWVCEVQGDVVIKAGSFGSIHKIYHQLFMNNNLLCLEEKNRIAKRLKRRPNQSDDAFRKVVMRESFFSQRVKHLHSKLPIFEDDEAFLIMRNLGQHTLDSYLLEHGGSLSTYDVYRIIINVLRALHEQVHSVHIIHADVKADNIIFNPETFEAYFIDFGCADDHDNPQFVNIPRGAPQYRDHKYYDVPACVSQKSDLFAIGLTFIRSLTETPSPKFSSDERQLIFNRIEENFIVKDPDRRTDLSIAIEIFEHDFLLYKLNKHHRFNESEKSLFEQVNKTARAMRAHLNDSLRTEAFSKRGIYLIEHLIQLNTLTQDNSSDFIKIAVQEFSEVLGLIEFAKYDSFNQAIEYIKEILQETQTLTDEINELESHVIDALDDYKSDGLDVHGEQLKALKHKLHLIKEKMHRAQTSTEQHHCNQKIAPLLTELRKSIDAFDLKLPQEDHLFKKTNNELSAETSEDAEFRMISLGFS